MFGNGTYTANKTNQVNVNTRLLTLYGDDSLVSVGAWNTNLSIKFHPAIGKNADGVTQYAQDNTSIVNAVITPDNARALLAGIEDTIIPAMKAGSNATVAVRTGAGENTKILCVGVENGLPFMYVAKNLNNGITDSANVITHHFASRAYITGYSYTTGSGQEVSVPTGFKNFVKRLECVDRLVPDVSHSISYSNAIRSAISSSFSQNANSDSPRYEAPVNTFDGSSTDEFLPFA